MLLYINEFTLRCRDAHFTALERFNRVIKYERPLTGREEVALAAAIYHGGLKEAAPSLSRMNETTNDNA